MRLNRIIFHFGKTVLWTAASERSHKAAAAYQVLRSTRLGCGAGNISIENGRAFWLLLFHVRNYSGKPKYFVAKFTWHGARYKLQSFPFCVNEHSKYNHTAMQVIIIGDLSICNGNWVWFWWIRNTWECLKHTWRPDYDAPNTQIRVLAVAHCNYAQPRKRLKMHCKIRSCSDDRRRKSGKYNNLPEKDDWNAHK